VFAVNWGQNQHKPSGENAIIGGTFAESITVPLSMLSKKPTGITHEQAAALALIGTTAYQALFDCLKVKRGDKVLILGGPTAVGSLAIQLAKNAGAWVATTASTRNIDYVEQFGPDLIVDYRKKDWSKDVPELVGIDAVFDAVGEKDGFARAVTDSKVIKDGGSFVSIANQDVGFDPVAHQPRLEFGSFYCLSNSATVQDSLAGDVAEGKLKVIIDRSFPFSKEGAVDMMNYIEGGTGRGKNVMTM
jgi:NADPH:quinone reductase-like Zn-dependent oxidoreductase